MFSGIRHAVAAAAMISAVARRLGIPVTDRSVRKRRTARRATGSPSSSPWNAGMTTTLRGSGQGHRVGERDDLQHAHRGVLRGR